MRQVPPGVDSPRNLRADCGNCFGLCCVALPFAASADFAFDKDAGKPCANLQADFRCGIHARLRDEGFPGCTVFDCFGAGQKISQVTFGGQDWRQAPHTAREMFEAFPVMRQLHELLWYLTEGLTLPPARQLRAEVPGHRKNHRGADLIGAKLAGANLRGANLRGADLSGADLTGSLFLTQSQVNAARGDLTTRLPSTLSHPPHWQH